MRHCGKPLRALAYGGGLLALASGGAVAGACDEYNPLGPAMSAQITLNATDFTDEMRDEMRSFIATDSIGKVDVAVVSASPGDAVLGISAVPEISRFSPSYGEELKGIAIAVALRDGGRRPVRLTLSLRQVCAKYFRNTFLYY